MTFLWPASPCKVIGLDFIPSASAVYINYYFYDPWKYTSDILFKIKFIL